MKLGIGMICMSKIDIDQFLINLHKKYLGKKIFFFSLGLLLSALAYNLFFVPYEVIPTGSSGLALLISRYASLDDAMIILLINLVCLLLGLVFFGYDYAVKMLFVTLIYPSFVSVTSLLIKYVDFEDTSLFLLMVFGGGLLGLSSGLIRKSGFSPGGFCVIFDLLQKYFHISVGRATVAVNILLIGTSAFVYGIDNAIYALVSLLVSSYIVDKVIIGISSNKAFYIVTEKVNDVCDYVTDNLHYDVTVVKSRGGYTHKRQKMLMCVVPTIEYVKLKQIILEIDPKAFFLIVDIYESSVKKNCKNM